MVLTTDIVPVHAVVVAQVTVPAATPANTIEPVAWSMAMSVLKETVTVSPFLAKAPDGEATAESRVITGSATLVTVASESVSVVGIPPLTSMDTSMVIGPKASPACTV